MKQLETASDSSIQPTKDNIKTLKSCRKDPIMETLNFLSKTTNIMNKDEAIENLCVVIQSYFPDICQICNQSYRVKMHDDSLLKCGSCGQEVHRPCFLKLLKNINLIDQDEELRDLIYQIPGMFYLCQHCQENTIN
eukprot:TCONS_00068659-protein